MIAAWIAHVDAAMAAALPAEALAALPVRERIRRLVLFRLDAVAGREEALRRALAIMAMPQNAARALQARLGTAPMRCGGSPATPRPTTTTTPSARSSARVYAATLAVFVDDHSEGKAGTRAFLDRRIAGIMRFEKAKAQTAASPVERAVQPGAVPRAAALSGA